MTSVSRRTLPEQVADAVLDLILETGLAVGDSLPSTSELADRFDVSVVVVREAMALLAGRGIVTRRQGREPVVAHPGPDVLDSILRVWIHQDGVSADEFLQCRAALELQSAALAASASDRETRAAALEPALESLRSAGSLEAITEADRGFHFALADLSGNPVVQLILSSLSSVLRDSVMDNVRRLLEQYGDDGRAVNVRVHERIARAVIAGDRGEAIEAMADHFHHYRLWRSDVDFGMIGYPAAQN